MKKKKVYIAGKMSNVPYYNHPKFMAAKAFLESLGYEVHTPFEISDKIWLKYYERPFDPYYDLCDYGDSKMLEMLAEDLALCLSCDVVALLDDWSTSKGAKLEVAAASTVGKEFWYLGSDNVSGPEEVDIKVTIYATVTHTELVAKTTEVTV